MSFDFSPSGLLAIRHLRFRRLWISVGVFLVLLVFVASLVSLPPPVHTVMLHDKLMHTLAYGFLMAWFAQVYRHDLTRLLLAIGLIIMGIVIEFAQGTTTYRQFDLLDMVANTSGVVLAWALAYTRVGNFLLLVESTFCKFVLRSEA